MCRIKNGIEIVYYSPAEGYFGLFAELYNAKGQLINTFQGPVKPPTLIQSLDSVVIDPTGTYLVACYTNQNISATGVTLNNSSNTYIIDSEKLLSSNSDPIAAAAICSK
jgi:hypothetical protein